MLHLTHNTKKLHLFIYSAVAIFYFWLAAQIPYTHDDWDWGLDIGLHQFLHATVNSRYVGNFFVIIMTRSELVKTMIMGTSYFLIPYLLSWFASIPLSDKRDSMRLLYFLLCNFLLLTTNRNIWAQTYSWVSGFANFGISVIFMIPWLYEAFHLLSNRSASQKAPLPYLLFLFIISFCSQLFIENLSIFHVLLAIFLCFLRYRDKRHIEPKYLVMLTGAILGIILMFSSSLYETLLSSGTAIDEYRQIPIFQQESIAYILFKMARTTALLLSHLYARNTTICIAIVLALMYLLKMHRAKITESNYKMARRYNCILLILLVGCFLSGIVFQLLTPENGSNYSKLLQFPISVLFLFIVTFELLLLFKGATQTRVLIFTLWFAAPILIAPLSMTTETGYRLFLPSNVLLILFLLSLLNQCFTSDSFPSILKWDRVLMLFVAACMAFYCIIYTQIGNCKQHREEIIATALQNASQEIVIPAYPFAEYLHNSYPEVYGRIDYFKEFYRIPSDVEIIFEK